MRTCRWEPLLRWKKPKSRQTSGPGIHPEHKVSTGSSVLSVSMGQRGDDPYSSFQLSTSPFSDQCQPFLPTIIFWNEKLSLTNANNTYINVQICTVVMKCTLSAGSQTLWERAASGWALPQKLLLLFVTNWLSQEQAHLDLCRQLGPQEKPASTVTGSPGQVANTCSHRSLSQRSCKCHTWTKAVGSVFVLGPKVLGSGCHSLWYLHCIIAL